MKRWYGLGQNQERVNNHFIPGDFEFFKDKIYIAQIAKIKPVFIFSLPLGVVTYKWTEFLKREQDVGILKAMEGSHGTYNLEVRLPLSSVSLRCNIFVKAQLLKGRELRSIPLTAPTMDWKFSTSVADLLIKPFIFFPHVQPQVAILSLGSLWFFYLIISLKAWALLNKSSFS